MNKEWAEKKNAEQEKKREEKLMKIRQLFMDTHLFTDKELDEIVREAKSNAEFGFTFLAPACLYEAHKTIDDFSPLLHAERAAKPLMEELMYLRYDYSRYIDSDPIEFDGDIIITDPCYVIKDDNHNDDWEKCEYGDNMEALGITHYMTRDTIYGDWSCSVYNTGNRRKIGDFCADAGLVSVFLLSDVLKYNPSFDYHINRKWTTALIKNFKGTVQFVVEEEPYEYDGEQCFDYCVRVVGHGFNKRSGKPLDFIGTQTGL